MSVSEIVFPEITAQHRVRAPWMKQAYKALSMRIHELKGKRKMPKDFVPKLIGSYMQTWSGNVESLDELREQARCLNIARGLLRGLKLEQIEATPRLSTGSKMEQYQYELIVKRALALITDDFPIYVAVNTAIGMTPEQQAVQAGHALASLVQGVRNLPWDADKSVLKYMDGSMLFGPAAANFASNVTKFALENPASTWCYFTEPDLGDRVTAVAIYAPFGLPWSLRHMPLLKMAAQNANVEIASQPRGSTATAATSMKGR